MPSRPRRSILATLPVLTSLVVVVVAVLLGLFAPLEHTTRGALGSLWPEEPLVGEVVIIDLDAEAIADLGPPPWAPATWDRIARDLATAGIDEVVIVEPAERLIHGAPQLQGPPQHAGARLLLAGAADAPPPLAARPDLAVTWTDDPAGLGASAAGPALCAWARCPTGSAHATPLRPERLDAVPRASLHQILQGEFRASLSADALVLLGFPTEGPWATSLVAGDPPRLISRTDGVGLAVATLRSAPPRPIASIAVVLPLAALLVLLGALVAHVEPLAPAEAWMLLLPVLVGLVTVALAAAGVLLLPVGPLALASVLGALAETLRLRSRMARFMRRLGHRLAAAEIGVPREARPDAESLLQQLASLTWNHLPTDRMLYVHREGSQARVIGGFGLSAQDLAQPLSPDLLRRLATEGRTDTLARDGRTAIAVVGLPFEGRVLGWWLVAWDPTEPGPDRKRLEDLARWVTEEVPPQPVLDPVGRLLRTDRRLDELTGAIERSDRAAERHRSLLRTTSSPLAMVDRAGTIVFQNQAFQELFGEETPRSVRELVFRVRGPVGLSGRMRALFEAGQPIRLVWQERGLVVRVSPAGRAGALVFLDSVIADTRSSEGMAAK